MFEESSYYNFIINNHLETIHKSHIKQLQIRKWKLMISSWNFKYLLYLFISTVIQDKPFNNPLN